MESNQQLLSKLIKCKPVSHKTTFPKLSHSNLIKPMFAMAVEGDSAVLAYGIHSFEIKWQNAIIDFPLDFLLRIKLFNFFYTVLKCVLKDDC